jgi:putative DNA primase/helicase
MRIRQVFLEGRPLFIFPCRGDNKKPTCPHGFYDAVTDFAGMARLWSDYYGALIGVPTGAINDLCVVDVDPRNGGDKWVRAAS